MGRTGAHRRNPQVLWRPLLEGVAVLGPADAPLMELRGLAALVWMALEEPSEVDDLVEEFRAARLEVPEDAADAVGEVLGELQSHSLVEEP